MEMGSFEIWCLVCLISVVSGQSSQDQLECYRCQYERPERDAIDQCKLTKYTCGVTHDTCVSYTQWKANPSYNMQTWGRQYSISKGCDTFEGCKRLQDSLKTHCVRNWYQDWACVECCQSNLCNYNVKLGSSSLHASIQMVITAVAVVLIARTMH